MLAEKVRPETIFAPTDAAFAALPPGFLESLLADKKKLFEVIRNHIVTGYQYSRGLETGPILTTAGAIVDVKVSPSELHFIILKLNFSAELYSQKFLISKILDGITYGGANVIIPDLTNVQGVIHIIDAVILTDSQLPSINKKY